MEKQTVLEVENLCVEIRNKNTAIRVVNKASLAVEKGKVLGIIGESGCGKSLLCFSLVNLLPANIDKVSGRIVLNGKHSDRLSNEQWKRIRGKDVALILQNPMSAFDPLHTIGFHFKETFEAHSASDAVSRAESLLSEMGFSDPGAILRCYPFQMSGGMLQRVMIALAFVHDPPLLIADEPSTLLDVVSQAAILDLMDSLRNHAGILLVTHDLAVVARMADHVAVMRAGEFIETGKTADIFEKPKTPYTRSLLDAHLNLYSGNLG